MTHGGDIYFEGAMNILDFSANISPLGLPAGVAEAVRQGLESCAVYPDPLCRALRSALAEHHQIDASRIVCGNGAADLIYRIVSALRPRKALICAPTFSEYEKALREGGAEITRYMLPAPLFRLDRSFIPKISAETDILFLCNPNNPTGILIDPALLQEIAGRCAETGTLLVMDECFNEFLDEPSDHSLKGFLNSMKGLIILKAFTKVYAMAGFRLGYCLCGSPETAAAVAAAGQAWPVSGIAQIAGIAALKEREYVEKLRALIQRERWRMRDALAALGLEALGGSANYLFFRIDTASGFEADRFYSALLDRGILVRNCANFSGLENRYCRIAVRKPEENQVLLETLQALKV
jgi:threonine-phosphate decarboxylase